MTSIKITLRKVDKEGSIKIKNDTGEVSIPFTITEEQLAIIHDEKLLQEISKMFKGNDETFYEYVFE